MHAYGALVVFLGVLMRLMNNYCIITTKRNTSVVVVVQYKLFRD